MIGNLSIRRGRKAFFTEEVAIATDSQHVVRDAYLILKDKVKHGYRLGRAHGGHIPGTITYRIEVPIYTVGESGRLIGWSTWDFEEAQDLARTKAEALFEEPVCLWDLTDSD